MAETITFHLCSVSLPSPAKEIGGGTTKKGENRFVVEVMERWEKERPRRCRECPSFSSALLDVIYRSTDESDGAGGAPEPSPVSAPRRSLPPSKVRTMARPRGLSHISASSSSDNSSFGGFSSSSEPDSSASRRARIRPIRTLPPPPPPRPMQRATSPPEKHHRGRARSFSIRSRLRDLGRSKAPSSPGSRFVSLLNSLFANAAGKQRKSKPSTVDDSACHAAPTRSRPCLVKTPLSRKGHDEGVKRSVRFHPVCVIMGEEVLPRGKNIPYAGERLAAARAEDQRRPVAVAEGMARQEARRKVEKLLRSLEVEEGVNEDEMSDSSSDLFELESLTISGDGGGYRDELPVYKTTHPGTAFSRGLVQL